MNESVMYIYVYDILFDTNLVTFCLSVPLIWPCVEICGSILFTFIMLFSYFNPLMIKIFLLNLTPGSMVVLASKYRSILQNI